MTHDFSISDNQKLMRFQSKGRRRGRRPETVLSFGFKYSHPIIKCLCKQNCHTHGIDT